jgi:cell wall-associated NlpC family hydrolase
MDVLNSAGAYFPMNERWSWSHFETEKYPPTAGQWGDPTFDIPGWVIVTDPQPGDVAAVKNETAHASGHVGIVCGPKQTIYTDATHVKITDWGFRDNNGGQVVFRRYVGLPPMR